MDLEKLKAELEKATPAQLATYTKQALAGFDRLKKAVDHLAKAAGHIAKAIDTHEKIGDAVDGLMEHHAAMGDHMANMQDCMGKAIATGKLGKVEDVGDAKDMTSAMSGIESAHGEMGKKHGEIEKLIDTQEEHLDNAEGSIDDAVAASDEETDKGLAAAERSEKMYNRKLAAIKKSNAAEMRKLAKTMADQNKAASRELEKGFNQLLNAIAPKQVPADIQKVVPARTAMVTLEKGQDVGAQPSAVATQPGTPPVAKVSTGAEIQATDEYGMPNPEYLKAVESGQLGLSGGTAFVKAAGKVEAQVGDPFPKDNTNLFAETHRPSSVN